MAGTDNLPMQIRFLEVGTGTFPQKVVVAGTDFFTSNKMTYNALQIIYKNKNKITRSIIVDTVHDRKMHEKFNDANTFSEQNYHILQQALLQADKIILTHEHPDHGGGLSQSPHFDKIIGKIFLTKEQITSSKIEDALFTKNQLKKLKALQYKKYHQIDSGVVLIKAAGHTPGSQIVYVKLENSKEYFLVGDIAWHLDNIKTGIGRPLLVSFLLLGENRDTIARQLSVLNKIRKKKKFIFVVAHDVEHINKLLKKGLLIKGFNLSN